MNNVVKNLAWLVKSLHMNAGITGPPVPVERKGRRDGVQPASIQEWMECIYVSNVIETWFQLSYNYTQKQNWTKTTPSYYIYIVKTVIYSQIKMTR